MHGVPAYRNKEMYSGKADKYSMFRCIDSNGWWDIGVQLSRGFKKSDEPILTNIFFQVGGKKNAIAIDSSYITKSTDYVLNFFPGQDLTQDLRVLLQVSS